MTAEPSDMDRSIIAVAYELALDELADAHPEAATMADIHRVMIDAILSLINAGHKDPEMLALYAANKGVEGYKERDNSS